MNETPTDQEIADTVSYLCMLIDAHLKQAEKTTSYLRMLIDDHLKQVDEDEELQDMR